MPAIDGFERIRVVDDYPLVYRLGRYLARRKVPGAWRLIESAHSLGLLEVFVRFELGRGVKFLFPLFIYPDDYVDVPRYEQKMLERLADAVASLGNDVVLVDCGADIGLVSGRLVATCSEIRQVHAIEPNDDVFAVLRANIEALPVDGHAVHCAVSDFVGKGQLISPAHDPSPHARYVAPADGDGGFDVRRVDDLGIAAGAPLLLKIDVEGAESAVIRGARQTLSAASDFVVVFEAHRAQVLRSGVDPVDIVKLVREIRDCTVTVSESPATSLDFERPFFEQLTSGKVYNLICRSR